MTLPPPELPPLPDWPPSNLAIIGTRQWAALGETLAHLHDEHVTLLGQFAELVHQLMLGQFTTLAGGIMATLADLNTQLDAIKASETAEAASLATLGTAMTTIITDLQALPPVGVLTQADLDAVVQKATDDATAAAANAATGAAQSTQASGAVPAPPSP